MSAKSSLVVVRTERLAVRRFATADATALHRYRNDPAVARYQGWKTPYLVEQAEALVSEMTNGELFALGGWTQLAVELRVPTTTPTRRAVHGELIGDVAVRMEADEPTAELGFSLEPTHWGHGIISEALNAVIDHLFSTLAVARVVAFTHPDNQRAHHTLERAGLRYIATDGDDLVYYRRND